MNNDDVRRAAQLSVVMRAAEVVLMCTGWDGGDYRAAAQLAREAGVEDTSRAMDAAAELLDALNLLRLAGYEAQGE